MRAGARTIQLKMEPLVPSTSAPFVPLRTASLPKHWTAWYRRFAVEALS